MTNDRFDHDLTAWLDAETTLTAPVGLHAQAIERARHVRQRPGWLVGLRGGSLGGPSGVVGGLDRRAIVVLAVLGLLIAGLAAAIGAGALRPDQSPSLTVTNGAIAYQRGADERSQQLFIACSNRTNEKPIAVRPGRSAGWPAWSPDGSRLAFNANFDDPDLTDDIDVWDIYTIDASGTDIRKLTSSIGLEGDPSWSPDGTQIVFGSTEPGKEGIWILTVADPGRPTLVLPTPEQSMTDYAPRFSPDGTRIAFTRETSDAAAALWVMNVDGTAPQAITTSDLQVAKAAWSPDGTRIVFDAASFEDPFRAIWTVRPDGTGLTKLDLPPSDPQKPGVRNGYSDPVWSPDGTQILFVRALHYGTNVTQIGLATARPDGSDLRWVADGMGDEHLPAWGTSDC